MDEKWHVRDALRDGNEKDSGRRGRLEKPWSKCDFGACSRVKLYLDFSRLENRLRKDKIFGVNSTVNINSKSKLMDVESHFVEWFKKCFVSTSIRSSATKSFSPDKNWRKLKIFKKIKNFKKLKFSSKTWFGLER